MTPVSAPPSEGCRAHGVSAEFVAEWWLRAEQQQAAVGVCACCLGPCPVVMAPVLIGIWQVGSINHATRCRRCEEAAV